ncbi:MAG TPA: sensor histidine kinase [Candidatus Dormibacteraeota bacterium]
MTSQPAARRDVWLAWVIGALCLPMLIGSVVLLVLDWNVIDAPATSQLPYLVAAPITGILGVLIATRRPRNPTGWLLLGIGASNVVSTTGGLAAVRGLASGAVPSGWVAWSAFVFTNVGSVGALLVAALILVFPDGHLLPGPRWRWATVVVSLAVAVGLAASIVAPAPLQLSPNLPSVPNPVGIGALNSLTSNGSPIELGILFMLLLVLAAAAVRLRRSRGIERSQMRWFAYVAAASVAVIVVGFFVVNANADLGNNISDLGFGFGFYLLVPATIGVAVMRYGLYDIDVFISRTLVYGSLAVFITAVYVGIAVGIGTLVGSGGKPNLALSILATAIVAIGFQPVRERVQRIANRLVYGKRATPYEVLSEFSGRVAETYAADEVLPRMARVLREGTGAESATVWLRGALELRPAATYPDQTIARDSLPMSNGSLPTMPDSSRVVEVRHQGELLGALSVTKRRGETLTPIEDKLVDDLAHQAGLVLKNVGLSADLQARLDELRASRQRLVHAQDLERRRLERNLHDGAQQHLVALKVKLGLAEMFLTRDPEKATAALVQLKHDADEALETLRDLARGIYPPLLADKGLVVALESQARKATVPVSFDADGVSRYSQDVEATVYFCVLEALQNVQKYAHATRAVVRIHADADLVTFDVTDDGEGFDVAVARKGAGLTNMNDRLDALGGRVRVTSEIGRGTTVRAEVPVTL